MLILLIIAVFKRPCFISPSKEHPPKKTILLWKTEYIKFQILEIDNLAQIGVKLLFLNNKKDKIDGKMNCLFVVFQHTTKFCCAAWSTGVHKGKMPGMRTDWLLELYSLQYIYFGTVYILALRMQCVIFRQIFVSYLNYFR